MLGRLSSILILMCTVAGYGQGGGQVQKNGSAGGGAPTGSAGGSLNGTYPNPGLSSSAVVGAISGQAIAPASIPSAVGVAAIAGQTIAPSVITGFNSAIVHAAAPDAEWAFLPSTSSLVSEADITGNSNTATFTGSGITRLPKGGLAFTGSGTLTTPLQTWKSLVARVCPFVYTTGTTNSGANPMVLWGPTVGTGMNALTTSFDTGNNGTWGLTPSFYDGVGNSTSGADLMGGCHTIVWVMDSNERIYVDGSEVPYVVQAAPTSATTSGVYQIGDGLNNGSYKYYGDLTYMYVYKTTVLTPTQAGQETAYVASKTGGPLDPYNSNFALSQTAQAVFVGDSITNGNGSTPFTTPLASLLTNTYAITNLGSGGDLARTEMSMHQWRVWPHLAAHSRNIVGYWFGPNDIGQSITALAHWNSMKASILADVNAGVEVFVMTTMDFGSSQTQKNAYNLLKRAEVAKMGPHVHLVDIAQDAEFGADGAAVANANALFSGDNLHLTTAGETRVANAWAAAINSVDGSSQGNPDTTSSNSYVGTVANNYVVQTPSAAATHQLSDCIYLTGYTRTIVNKSTTFSITVSTTGTGSIVGDNIVPPLTTATYTAMLTGPTTGGCYWQNNAPAAAPVVIHYSFSSGAIVNDAAPRILIPRAGNILGCAVLTTTSDASTALTFNIFDNGTSMLSGGAQTVAAATSAGTISSFTLTSTPLAVALNDKISVNITGGASDWVFSLECK